MGDVIQLKEGEGKWLSFTIRREGVIVPCGAAVFTLGIKRLLEDTELVIEKTDAAFDKTDAANGIVRVNLSATNTVTLGTGVFPPDFELFLMPMRMWMCSRSILLWGRLSLDRLETSTECAEEFTITFVVYDP